MSGFVWELDAPFERMTDAAASALLREVYGLEPVALKLLDTERDDSFRVTTADQQTANHQYVLKVANPTDSLDDIEFQTLAMQHAVAADPRLPLQRVLPALDGSFDPVVNGRVVRLLSWLDGTLLMDVVRTPATLHGLGMSLARLAAALRGFDHPAAHRTFAWDIQSLDAMRPLLDLGDFATVAAFLDRFDAVVLPRMAGLPHQFVQHDFHPGNVLVGDEPPHPVTGILDFGDALWSARATDIGVALAYLAPRDEPPWPFLKHFVAGYRCVTELTQDELELIPAFAAARQAQRILMSAKRATTEAHWERIRGLVTTFDNLHSHREH
ncbi:MAG: phosphotransferase [Rhodoglobus sp.]